MSKSMCGRAIPSVLLASVCGLFAACGSGDMSVSSTGSGSSSALDADAITTISELPTSTGPVDSDASGNLAAKRVRMEKSAATTGENIATASTSDFTSSSSMSMCETVNRARDALREASTADKTACYMAHIVDHNLDSLSNLYDDTFHIIGLSFGDSGNGANTPGKVKVRAKKDNGNVTHFTMYTCSQANQQTQFVQKSIDGTNFSMTTKSSGTVHAAEGVVVTYANAVTAAGTLNAAGHFTGDKTITVKFTNSSDDPTLGAMSSYAQSSLVQTSSNLLYSGAEHSIATGGAMGTFTQDARLYSIAQLIDGNAADASVYDPTLLALGSGAAQLAFSATVSDYSFSNNYTESWNGDTTASESSNDFSAIAAAATLPDVLSAAPDVAMTDDEVYDCSDDPDVTITVTSDEMTSMQSDCREIDRNTELNCYEAVVSGGSSSGSSSGGSSGGSSSSGGGSDSSSGGSGSIFEGMYAVSGSGPCIGESPTRIDSSGNEGDSGSSVTDSGANNCIYNVPPGLSITRADTCTYTMTNGSVTSITYDIASFQFQGSTASCHVVYTKQ